MKDGTTKMRKRNEHEKICTHEWQHKNGFCNNSEIYSYDSFRTQLIYFYRLRSSLDVHWNAVSLACNWIRTLIWSDCMIYDTLLFTKVSPHFWMQHLKESWSKCLFDTHNSNFRTVSEFDYMSIINIRK